MVPIGNNLILHDIYGKIYGDTKLLSSSIQISFNPLQLHERSKETKQYMY